jgi:hypothetical protein
MDNITNFVFRGLLCSRAVAEMEAEGLLRTPAQTPEERSDHDMLASVQSSIRGASIEMQRYYRLLYVFENLVRSFVDERFREEDQKDDWWSARSTTDMRKKVEIRKREEQRNAWHPGRNQHPLFHVDFGDLALLITNHWPVFKDYFPDQSWVASRIQETEKSRNIIAHTNRLPADEGVRLERHLRDWLAQVP